MAGGRRRYAICGLSSRAVAMFALPLVGGPAWEGEDYSAHGELVAILDADPERIAAFNRELPGPIPGFGPDEFDRMVAETRPEVVIAAGVDSTHAEHVIAALEQGLDAITEKPMVVSSAQALDIIAAERSSPGTVRVTHNSRYTPAHKLIKRIVAEGRLGRVTNVEFAWNLDTYHGASYFWRWNREREKSGGLTITKACHHFDLLNWWLDDRPARVFAAGALNYYGARSPHNPSVRDGVDYSVAEQRERSPYERRWAESRPADDHLDMRQRLRHLPSRRMYPEDHPIYLFDEEIRIEDTYSAVIRYRGGASVSYSMNASSPWEGYRLAINGTHARLESIHYTSPSRCPFPTPPRQVITVLPLFAEPETLEADEAQGSHGGADVALQHELFVGPTGETDELALRADAVQGAYAVAIGEAMWRSVETGEPVDIDALLPPTALPTS